MLIGGILLSVVIGLLVLVLATGRRRALSLVHEKTHELSQKNRELAHQALHDPLTGLPNRALVLDRAEQLIERTAPQLGTRRRGPVHRHRRLQARQRQLRPRGRGPAAEDRRRPAAERRSASRTPSGRLGGDEFVVLSELKAGEATLNMLADRLTEVLREPVELEDGRKISSRTVSIGVAIGAYADPDSLLRDADLALYAAKAAGKDRFVLFDASMSAGDEDRPQLEADLRTAAQDPREQFKLLYQPIYELKSAKVRRRRGADPLASPRPPDRASRQASSRWPRTPA